MTDPYPHHQYHPNNPHPAGYPTRQQQHHYHQHHKQRRQQQQQQQQHQQQELHELYRHHPHHYPPPPPSPQHSPGQNQNHSSTMDLSTSSRHHNPSMTGGQQQHQQQQQHSTGVYQATTLISEEELNDCDREPLMHIGAIQGGAGHCLYVSRCYDGGAGAGTRTAAAPSAVVADTGVSTAATTTKADSNNKKASGTGKTGLKKSNSLRTEYIIEAADETILQLPWIRAPTTPPITTSSLPARTAPPPAAVQEAAPAASAGAAAAAAPAASASASATTDDQAAAPTGNANNANPNPKADDKTYKDYTKVPIIGRLLSECIPESLYDDLVVIIDSMEKNTGQRSFEFFKCPIDGRQSYACSVTTTDDTYNLIGIEIEEIAENDTANTFVNTIVNLGCVLDLHSHETIVKEACDTIYELLGNSYDRGMVYRFNDDLSGEVIHEIKNDDIISTSYAGMRFPSTDIPLIARQLYCKNGLRYILDVDGESVPLVSRLQPVNPSLHEDAQRFGRHYNTSIDLTQCRMRAVAKPHLIYLKNMGVTCSLSIALVVQKQLWGLLAYHGYHEPSRPSLPVRISIETIAAMVSVRVEALIKERESERISRLSDVLVHMKPDQSVLHNLHELGGDILHALEAEILVAHVVNHDEALDEPGISQESSSGSSSVSAGGTTPLVGHQVVVGEKSLAPSANSKLWKTFMAKHPDRELGLCQTREQLESMGLTEEDCPASGIAYFREGRTHILIGRKERSKDVVWAGNPDQPKLRIGGILCPRNSFETFMEKARRESRAFTTQDQRMMSLFRDIICDHSRNWMMMMLQSDIEDTNKKYMNAIDRARDNYEFFAHMSHELRTPFHGVLGCLTIMRDTLDTIQKAEMQDLLDTAIASGNHMMTLLNDILDISKKKHLSHDLNMGRVLFSSLAFEAIDGMKSLAQSRSVRLGCTISPKECSDVIITDRTKFIQIVSNMMNNSIKFTGDGGIDVMLCLVPCIQDAIQHLAEEDKKHAGSVFALDAESEGEMIADVDAVVEYVKNFPKPPKTKWMYFAVKDTGCGIAPDELSKMFLPYTQASSGTSRAFQGTGLGLFICMSLTQRMGGFIACGSTPGVGTTFHVGVPVEVVDSPSDGCTSVSADVANQEPSADILMTGPILIVDDNKVNLKVLKRTLEIQFKHNDLSFPILVANGGAEAVEMYKSEMPSLCIIDYHMPEVDGIEATLQIRKFEKEMGIERPTFVMSYTADATEKAKNLIFDSGADEIMSKPPPKGFIDNFVKRLKPYPVEVVVEEN